MSHLDSDSIVIQPVPRGLGPAFEGAFIGRAPVAELTFPVERAVGLGGLHRDERLHAGTRSARRAREFIAGRVALRAALEAAGWSGDEALLPGEQGRPGLPPGWTGSISHKDGVAFAIARRLQEGRTLGIDTEVVGDRERVGIARKVLTPVELARWERTRSWAALLETFSTKESIYKALHPHVSRYIGFEEAERDESGGLTLALSGNEGPFALSGGLWWEGALGPSRRLVTIVEASAG